MMSQFGVIHFLPRCRVKIWSVCWRWDTLRPTTVHWACSEWLATYKLTSCIPQHYVLSCKSRLIYIYVKEIYFNFNGLFKVSCTFALIYCIGFILAMSNNILFENMPGLCLSLWCKYSTNTCMYNENKINHDAHIRSYLTRAGS